MTPHRLFRALFGAAILTIGLDQYRPFLGAVGNLSDLLFGAVFMLGAVVWLARVDLQRFHGLLEAIREVEALIWGGFLLTLGGAIASVDSAAPSASWRVTLKYSVMFCVWLPWVAVAIKQYSSVTKAYILYVAGFCLLALGTLSDLFIGTHFGARLVSTPIYESNLENLAEGLRYGGPTGHPNTLGYVSAIGLLLCFWAAATGPWRRVWAPFLGLVTCGATLMISGSRAAFLGVAVGCLTLLWLSEPNGRKRVLMVIVGCLSALWIASTATDLGLEVNPVERLLESIQPRRSFEADWQRTHDLRLSQTLLLHDPLTGYGMEDIGTATPPTKVAFNLPHFVVLQSWVAGGVLALLGTLWLYGVALWVGWKAVRLGRPMALGLFVASAAFILMDMVHPGLDQRFKWFAVALLVATLRRTNDSRTPESELP